MEKKSEENQQKPTSISEGDTFQALDDTFVLNMNMLEGDLCKESDIWAHYDKMVEKDQMYTVTQSDDHNVRMEAQDKSLTFDIIDLSPEDINKFFKKLSENPNDDSIQNTPVDKGLGEVQQEYQEREYPS